jgi:hypothetical protein
MTSGYWAAPDVSCLFRQKSNGNHALCSQVWASLAAALVVLFPTMIPTAPQARERARRAHDTNERELRRRKPDRTAPVATGTSLNDISLTAPGALALRSLANLIARYAPHDGVFPLRLPGTYALRRGRITSEPVYATMAPSLCIVAQGAKVLMLGSEVLEYDPARMLVFAVDLPVSGQVTRASQREPFLGFKLDLDPARVAQLAPRVFPRGVPKPSNNRGLVPPRRLPHRPEAPSTCPAKKSVSESSRRNEEPVDDLGGAIVD